MHIVYVYPAITIKAEADKVIVEKANYFALHGYQVKLVSEAQMGRELSFPLDEKVRHIEIGIGFNRQYAYHSLHRLWTSQRMLRKYEKKLEAVPFEERSDIVVAVMGRNMDFILNISDGSVKSLCGRKCLNH